MSYGDPEPGGWADQVTPPAATRHVSPVPLGSMRGQGAGWYVDPLAPQTHRRWWTGAAWADETHPPGGPVLPPAMTGRTGRRRAWRAAGLAGGLAVLAGAGLWVSAPRSAQHSPAPRALAPTSGPVRRGPSPAVPLLLPGIPADARSSCVASATAVTCTWHGPTAAGTATCSRTDHTATCSVTDNTTSVTSTTSCVQVGADLRCQPRDRLDTTQP